MNGDKEELGAIKNISVSIKEQVSMMCFPLIMYIKAEKWQGKIINNSKERTSDIK